MHMYNILFGRSYTFSLSRRSTCGERKGGKRCDEDMSARVILLGGRFIFMHLKVTVESIGQSLRH
jgi:hypothetical protein